MQNFVGVLTISTWVDMPDNKRGKRLTVHKSHFCESFDMGKEILDAWRQANPDMKLHAELTITRYID